MSVLLLYESKDKWKRTLILHELCFFLIGQYIYITILFMTRRSTMTDQLTPYGMLVDTSVSQMTFNFNQISVINITKNKVWCRINNNLTNDREESLYCNVTVYLLNNYRFIQITQQEMTLAFLLFYNLPVKMWIITGQPAMLNKLP